MRTYQDDTLCEYLFVNNLFSGKDSIYMVVFQMWKRRRQIASHDPLPSGCRLIKSNENQ